MKPFIHLLACIVLSSIYVRGAEPGLDDYFWNEDTPPALLKLFKASPQLKSLKISHETNPFYLAGDFDGDGRLDYAVQVKSKDGQTEDIAILLACGKTRLLSKEVGGNRPGNAWYVLARGGKLRSRPDLNEGQAAPKLTTDTIMLAKPESSAAVIYWQAGHFLIYWLTD